MLIHQLNEYHGLSKGWANPEFWELMMAWPIGWTDLKPLATDKFRRWLRSHGVCLEGQTAIVEGRDDL